MNIHITTTIHVSGLERAAGMVRSKELQKYLAARVRIRNLPYVPMASGALAQINSDGSLLTYPGPYAHYQYYGQVMGPNVLTKLGWRSMAKKGGKHYTGKALNYNGAPMRGSRWDKRMLADHRSTLEQDVAAFLMKQLRK